MTRSAITRCASDARPGCLAVVRVALVALLALAVLPPAPWAAPVGPGDAAPDFALQDLSGTTYRLSDLRGKVVLLDFIGYNCAPCIASSPAVEVIWRDFEPTGVFQVLALDMWNGSPSLVQSFIDQTGVTYPVLRNAGFLQSEAFYGITFDNFIVVDADGIVRYTSVDEPFGSFNEDALRAAIVENLPVSVQISTWSAVKHLYQRGTPE